MGYETGARGDSLECVQGSGQRRSQRHLKPGHRYGVGFETGRGPGAGIFELPNFPGRLYCNNSRPAAADIVRWEEDGVALVDLHKNRKGEPLEDHETIECRRWTAQNVWLQRVRNDFLHCPRGVRHNPDGVRLRGRQKSIHNTDAGPDVNGQ